MTVVWSNPLDWNIGQATCVARFDERIIDNIEFSGSHAHTGVAGDGAALAGCWVGGCNAAQSVLLYTTVPAHAPACQLAGDGFVLDTNAFGNGFYRLGTDNVIGASAQWLLDLYPGVWELKLLYTGVTDGGILSACLDGIFAGCVDTYRSSGTYNIFSEASQVTISSSGQKILRLIITASNASSTSYRGLVSHIDLRRVSA